MVILAFDSRTAEDGHPTTHLPPRTRTRIAP